MLNGKAKRCLLDVYFTCGSTEDMPTTVVEFTTIALSQNCSAKECSANEFKLFNKRVSLISLYYIEGIQEVPWD